MRQKVECPVCKRGFSKSYYVKHLKKEHIYEYEELVEQIIKSNNEKYCVKDISVQHNVPEKFVENQIEVIRESETEYVIEKPLKIKEWEPKNYKIEATTIWSFPDRGKWATHSGTYRGNWSPYIPRNVILRYSSEGDIVLDQFIGSGTTLVETKLLNRKGIGVDINPEAILLSRKNTGFRKDGTTEVGLHQGDARNLNFIGDESIDLICTHPPYSDIIKYSEDIEGDLSHLDVDSFLREMSFVAKESFRVLKKDKYCAILIGDMRKKKHVIPLGFSVMEVFKNAGFVLKEIIIKEQHNCKATGYWYKQSVEYNFLLLAHEYLFVFRKP